MTTHSHLRRLVLASILACAGWVSAWAQSAPFPGRQSIEIVVPFPPGGSVDPIARALQAGMKQPLGATLVVANQPGAGGTLGTARVARAPADGYVLGLTTVGPLTTQPHMAKLPYGTDSFEYVCRTHVTPQLLVVPSNSQFRTLAEFVAFAKGNPGKVVMSSTGVGSLPHLAAVEFGQLAGFEWLHVPTKGDSDAAQLALAGEITAWVAGAQTYAQLGPRLRALGILEPERNAAIPDVPTFKEQGYPLLSAGWGGLVAPKGTPADVVAKLAQACDEATRTPEFGRILQMLKVPQGHLGPDDFAAFVRAESERYGRLIGSVGGAAQVRTN